MCQHCKHNEESGKNQSNFKFERVTAVLIFRLIGHILGASMTGMDKPRNNCSYHRHNQKIKIDRCKYLPAKDQNQYHKTQKHHADRKQHSSYIFVRLLLGSLSAFTGQYRNCGSTTIQSTDNAGNQYSRFMKHIAFQQVRQIRDTGDNNRRQPNRIRSEINIRNQVLVR